MSLVKVFYQYRVNRTKFVEHKEGIQYHRELCRLIDDYPWFQEIELTDQLGKGGGFEFILGDYGNKFAAYHFIPIGLGYGLLYLQIVTKPGFMRFFGRKSITRNFDLMSTCEAKVRLRELFDHTIESLYDKYNL